jgi:hypothetical protein
LKKINTDEKKIITPTKSICCKNDTNAGSESTSTSLASPLKKISTNPIQSDEEDSGKSESTSTSLASPLKKINTDEKKLLLQQKAFVARMILMLAQSLPLLLLQAP